MNPPNRTPQLVEDPSTGDQVTLHELAKRHGISKATVYARYRYEKRGLDLIEPPINGNISDTLRDQRAQEARERYIEEAKRTPLAMPFKHIASASKMVGGVQ